MTLKNIKQQGFTIVELLIVIVVIGILAAITIVAYTGITSQAKYSKVVSNADSIRTVAEAFNSQYGRYPATLLEFTDGEPAGDTGTPITKRPTGITILSAAIAAPNQIATALTGAAGVTTTNGETNVAVYRSPSTGTSDGGVIIFWDYKTGLLSTSATSVYYGSATASSTFDELT